MTLCGTIERVATVTHLPSELEIDAWSSFTEEEPCRVLVSACLRGVPCGVDGTSYDAPFTHTERLFLLPNVRVVTFCPEDLAFGTPRASAKRSGPE